MSIKCKICRSSTIDIWDQQFAINYYYCSSCQYISMDEGKIISAQEEREVYKQHNNTLENEGYVQMFKDFIAGNIVPYVKEGQKALDFGCGPGPVLAHLLRNKGLDVDIYDPYFFPQKTFLENKYVLITSTEVFEHLKDPLKTTTLLKDHIFSGGILAIMTQFHPGPQEFKDWWYRRDPTHISFFTPKTFKVLAEKINVQVLQFDKKKTSVLKNNLV